MKLSAILLAAGLSRRMGQDKLLMEYQGTTLIQRAVKLLLDLPAGERVVVVSKGRFENIAPAHNLRVIINDNPEEGLSGSVRLGVSNASGTHFLFLNADQPELTASEVMQLINRAEGNPDMIVYPAIDEKPCSPVIFPAAFRSELMALTGDSGGRIIRDSYPGRCLGITVKNPEKFKDIDYEVDI